MLLNVPFSAPLGTAVWAVFEDVWNSGASTSAKISVVNLNTQFGGNDYALDDIAFSRQSVNTPVPEPGLTLPTAVALGLLLRRCRR